MQAIILAAGRGSRMKALTENHPKCFLELGGKTLLEWQTEALIKAGIPDISIVTGYREKAFKNLPYRSFNNPHWKETNMVSSLMCASILLEKTPCIISYSDIVYHPSIISLLMQAVGNIAITYDNEWLTLWKERFINPLEDAESFTLHEGNLFSIGEKASTLDEIQGQYMGLLKITPAGWSEIKQIFHFLPTDKQKTLDMTSLLQLLLKKNKQITAVPINGKWCEVDREEDLHLYQKNLSYCFWKHDWR